MIYLWFRLLSKCRELGFYELSKLENNSEDIFPVHWAAYFFVQIKFLPTRWCMQNAWYIMDKASVFICLHWCGINNVL